MQETKATKKYNGPKLFVGCLSPATTPQSLRAHFEALCPVQVVKVEFSRKSKNKKGFGYVIIDRPEDVDRLLSMTHVIDSKLVDVKPYSLQATSAWYSNKAASVKLRIRNVPAEISEQQIALFFERFARVLVVNILQEESREAGCLENVAYLELLNAGTPLTVGKRVFSCDPHLTQSVNFFSIDKQLGGLRGPYSAPLTQSPSADSQADSRKRIRSLLDFEDRLSCAVHSKYEFIRTQQVPKDDQSNYRFNIRVPGGLSAEVRLLARRVASSVMPTGSSLLYFKQG